MSVVSKVLSYVLKILIVKCAVYFKMKSNQFPDICLCELLSLL